MQIKLQRRTTSGAALLLGILVILVAGLGGCAAYKIIKKGRELEKKRNAQMTNNIVEPNYGFKLATPIAPTSESPDSYAPVVSTPHFQIKTNAFDDDSGF